MKIAIITDIHEDLIYLKEALGKINRIKVDEIFCLGDISGYSHPFYNYLQTRNAHECLSAIRSDCKITILGNHDIHSAQIIPKNCPFFEFPDNWYNLDYHERYNLGHDILWLHEENDLNPLYKKNDIDYLQSLPEYVRFETPEINILLTHYVYPNISGLKKEFYTYADEFHQHFAFMESLNCNISFTGHAHVKGFFMATEKKFKQYGYIKKYLPDIPVCIGIPPITRTGKRSGFCVFDTKEMSIQMIRS